MLFQCMHAIHQCIYESAHVAKSISVDLKMEIFFKTYTECIASFPGLLTVQFLIACSKMELATCAYS